MIIVAIIAIIAIAAIIIVVKKKKKEYKDVSIPMPATLRNDLLYGYYGSLDRTWAQVKDNVNLFWFFNFYGRDQLVQQIYDSPLSMKFVLDLGQYLSTKPEGQKLLVYKDDDGEDLRSHFQYLKNAGVLHRITYLYPIDEPQLQVKNAEEHKKMLDTAKRIAAEFEELKDVRWAVTYLRENDFWNIEYFDVVGVDHYPQLSSTLTTGEHARLLKAKLPHQKTLLIPGCGYNQNPDPFVAYAHAHPEEVEMVVPFLWFEYEDKSLKDDNFTGLEERDMAYRETWIDAGWKVMNKPRTTGVWVNPNQKTEEPKAPAVGTVGAND